MIRNSYTAMLFLAAATIGASQLWTAEQAIAGSVAADSQDARNTYLSSLDATINRFNARAGEHLDRARGNDGTGIQLWFNPMENRQEILGIGNYNATDAEWARANLRLYDIIEKLGGVQVGYKQEFRRLGNRYYVGLDGVGGAWFTSPAEAQGYLVKLIASKSAELAPAVKSALAALTSNDITDVLNAARNAMLSNRAFLSRGERITLTLTGSGFTDAAGTPHVEAPEGIRVDDVAYVSSGKLSVTLAITQEAPLGNNRLYVFERGQAFRYKDDFPIYVTSGSGTPPAAADEAGSTTATALPAALNNTVNGRIGDAEDEDIYSITLASGGTLNITTDSDTDIDATLEDATGNAIARDEDSGNWYNPSLSVALAPGTYYLRLRQCCGGTGAYSITTNLQ